MKRPIVSTILLAVVAGLPAPLAAQAVGGAGKTDQPPVAAPAGPGDRVAIAGQGGVTGAVSVNAASGANNQQANAGVIANGGAALAGGNITQSIRSSGPSDVGQNAHVVLGAGAFAGSSGLIAVNAASGVENQQINLALVAKGIEGLVVSDTTLAQTRASPLPAGETGAANDGPERTVAIGSGAFANSSGIVQLSLVGGDRNTTANSFALLVAGSAGPE